jgi:hypothetical protein
MKNYIFVLPNDPKNPTECDDFKLGEGYAPCTDEESAPMHPF